MSVMSCQHHHVRGVNPAQGLNERLAISFSTTGEEEEEEEEDKIFSLLKRVKSVFTLNHWADTLNQL